MLNHSKSADQRFTQWVYNLHSVICISQFIIDHDSFILETKNSHDICLIYSWSYYFTVSLYILWLFRRIRHTISTYKTKTFHPCPFYMYCMSKAFVQSFSNNNKLIVISLHNSYYGAAV